MLLSFFKKYFRLFGLLNPLTFDQQINEAKSLMDEHQLDSRFFDAEGGNGETLYTGWSGSIDNKPYAITVDPNGFTTGPTYDDSKVGSCSVWEYPPNVSCADAVIDMTKAGITETWTWCRLRGGVDPQYNPFYDFLFTNIPPVHVDSVNGIVIKT